MQFGIPTAVQIVLLITGVRHPGGWMMFSGT